MNRWIVNSAVAIAGLLGVVGTSTAAQAAPSSPNLAANPSFEQPPAGGRPPCWALTASPSGAGKYSLTDQAHSGSSAVRIEDPYRKASQFRLAESHSPNCAVVAVPGHSYTISIWYRSSAPVRLDAELKAGDGDWVPWQVGSNLPASPTWARAELVTPAAPEGSTALGFGISMPGANWLFADDASVLDNTRFALGRLLYKPVFPSTNTLITNEYATWNAGHSDAVKSRDWEMGSGSLFAMDGGGSSGRVNAGTVDAMSSRNTDSAVFRLNTKRSDFGDVQVSFNATVQEVSKTERTPANSYDGVHIWLRYQSQYELYAASVARRDGHVVIKKKCPGGDINGGSYYNLGPEMPDHRIAYGTWWNASVSVHNNKDGSVTISIFDNGAVVATATDTGVGCAPLTRSGAVGIRGDNTRFQFNNFTVTTA